VNADNRKYTRFELAGLTADIILSSESLDQKVALEGTVINLSYTGIKIRLTTPISEDMGNSKILIKLTMPESGIPITIHGVLKHITNNSELGLQFQSKEDQEMDSLMFECIKIASNHQQLNSISLTSNTSP